MVRAPVTVCALLLAKDEADIIGVTLRHLRGQVDAAIVLDNGSTDGTRQIIDEVANETGRAWITVLDDPEVGYFQSRKTTRLARMAAEAGYEWVVPCDADEIWYSTFGTVGEVLAALPPWVDIAEAVLYDHVATGLDPALDNPVRRIGWRRRNPGALPKVACRVRPGLVIEMGNHHAHYPGTVERMQTLVIRHFPYRSPEQMVSKVTNGAAAYRATDLPPTFGQHWRDYGELLDAGGPEAIHDVFRTWFWSADPENDATLMYDPAPV